MSWGAARRARSVRSLSASGLAISAARACRSRSGEKEAAVDLTIVVEYGESIPKLSQQIRENVTRRIEGITGLAVTEVNVTVNDLHFPGDEESDDEAARVQ